MKKLLVLLIAVIALTGCRDEYQEARDKCYRDYPQTVDYVKCVNEVNARQQADEDDAVILSTTIAAATVPSTM